MRPRTSKRGFVRPSVWNAFSQTRARRIWWWVFGLVHLDQQYLISSKQTGASVRIRGFTCWIAYGRERPRQNPWCGTFFRSRWSLASRTISTRPEPTPSIGNLRMSGRWWRRNRRIGLASFQDLPRGQRENITVAQDIIFCWRARTLRIILFIT